MKLGIQIKGRQYHAIYLYHEKYHDNSDKNDDQEHYYSILQAIVLCPPNANGNGGEKKQWFSLLKLVEIVINHKMGHFGYKTWF